MRGVREDGLGALNTKKGAQERIPEPRLWGAI